MPLHQVQLSWVRRQALPWIKVGSDLILTSEYGFWSALVFEQSRIDSDSLVVHACAIPYYSLDDCTLTYGIRIQTSFSEMEQAKVNGAANNIIDRTTEFCLSHRSISQLNRRLFLESLVYGGPWPGYHFALGLLWQGRSVLARMIAWKTLVLMKASGETGEPFDQIRRELNLILTGARYELLTTMHERAQARLKKQLLA